MKKKKQKNNTKLNLKIRIDKLEIRFKVDDNPKIVILNLKNNKKYKIRLKEMKNNKITKVIDKAVKMKKQLLISK